MDKIKRFLMSIFDIKNSIINSCIESSCYLCSIFFLILSYMEGQYVYSLFILSFSFITFFIGFALSRGKSAIIAILKELSRFAFSFYSLMISIYLIYVITQNKKIISTIFFGIILSILILFCLTYMVSRFIYIKRYIKNLFRNSKIILPPSISPKKHTFKTVIENIMSFLIPLATFISTIINIFK